MFAKALIFALAAAGAATAQAPVQNYTSSLDMQLNPSQATAQERAQWCSAETNSCSQLCGNTESKNDCSATDLTYNCLCSNGSAPGLQYYSQTMPTFICQKLFDLCNTQNVGNARNQEACKTNIMSHCGTLDPTKASTGGSSSSSTSGSSTASSKATSSAGDSGSASTTSSSKAIAAPTMAAGQGIAAAAAAVGVFAYLI
ncbi:PCI domain-containing protein [Beauveria brongniartii RCEF 3172]|uniref:PCI domain-containing protein n=1 Tax=Beauveria brongniartii RCEF 3172 TaxID=1081107 RepID=A0A162JTZ6_9HYPO|nr:PCI domain-containing protein [Beauveria brongniartii RCEF 3172]